MLSGAVIHSFSDQQQEIRQMKLQTCTKTTLDTNTFFVSALKRKWNTACVAFLRNSNYTIITFIQSLEENKLMACFDSNVAPGTLDSHSSLHIWTHQSTFRPSFYFQVMTHSCFYR